MKYPTTCDCNQRNNNGTCPVHSRVKMGIMLMSGCDDLKVTSKNGKLSNPYWYNYMKNNNRNQERIVADMVRRFKKDALYNFTNVLLFFDNNTNTLIARVKL